ncbi:MAG TPA: hypothetical protein VG537_06960 [Candidatus Kapabacteria bacterium]|jgi:A/G-specific adenine glycosylase|nr:hypothetical protein [Candidatus Kapabacteria bacterium]
MKLHPSTRTRFDRVVPTILQWYKLNQRSFIWRGVTRSPYVVLVSEFMLQQTGARQVEKILPVFLRQFPNVHTLAGASPAEVLRAWKGLGYNRRALNLHRAAKTISARGRRPFPRTLDALQALPGVGRYTASAILAFKYNEDVPVVDVNIERVLSRIWKPMHTYSETLPIKQIYDLDAEILPRGESARWHEALMDFGSVVCTKKSPNCAACPIRYDCASSMKFLKKEQASLIEKIPPKEPRYFGHPRRIWRGRILTIVMDRSAVSLRVVTSSLQKTYGIEDDAFPKFISDLAKILVGEGILARNGNNLTLPS